MTASKVKGYYHATGTTTSLPLNSHPITYQQIGQDMWTHRPTNLALDIEQTEPTTEKLIIGSDGLLHIHEQVAAAAWIISTEDTKHLSATFLMTNISSFTSHRIELEGIFRALHHLDLLNITPKMVEQWCDNKQAVKDSTTTTDGPSMMIKAEADIILAIHHLRNRFPFHTNIKHIYGHQDTKKPKRHTPQDETSQTTKEVDTPSNNPQASPPVRIEPFLTRARDPQQALPIKVQINIACDGIATETTRIALGKAPPTIHQTILTPPYDGSRAMLKIGKTWITSHYKKAIYDAHRTPAMTAYMINKYSWTTDTIKTVNWASINSVRRTLSDTKRMQTCKIMHGWLPLGHMRHHITGINQCPGCTSTNETIDHMLKCPHLTITEKREVVLSQMLVKGKQNKIPKGYSLHSFNYSQNTPPVQPTTQLTHTHAPPKTRLPSKWQSE
jgi:ribonuclease HI